MTEQPTPTHGHVPELTLGWRLKMSLGEMTREQIAQIVDYTPSTISRWFADQGAPRRSVIAQWALATGVDRDWLETGTPSAEGPNGDGGQGADTVGEHAALAQLAEQLTLNQRVRSAHLTPVPLAA